MSSGIAAAGVALPAPSPSAAPAPPVGERAPRASADVISRPTAQPTPSAPTTAPPDPAAGLPILIAAGFITGGAALVLPAIEAASSEAGVAAAAPVLAKGGKFALDALRDAAATYRAGTEHVTKFEYSDPHVVGRAIGAQAWTSTEELVRSTITGIGLGAGAWAGGKLCSAIAGAVTGRFTHAADR